MSALSLTIVLVLAAVLGAAVWMDYRRHRLGDTKTGGVVSRETRAIRRADKERSARWGAGG